MARPNRNEVYFDNYVSNTPADAAEKAYEAGKNYFAQSDHHLCAVYNLEEEYSCRVGELEPEEAYSDGDEPCSAE